ncbi:MAG: Uncharacterized protein Greene041619_1094 [Candidatus Peregrinibacteria bacterium Greene0416_19]|nr:MAG: Uncharacterized protein Greene041619_1094 [Candidatus Peregrinibacteria bacterium Greene0416_19]
MNEYAFVRSIEQNYALQERLREKLSRSKHPLVLGVGGGNDAVSTLLLQKQLQRDFDFHPERVSVMAVLPDCLDYHYAEPTPHPLIHEITPHTQRSVQGKLMTQFPERVLAQFAEDFGIDRVLGISMKSGSRGMAEALAQFTAAGSHDLVLACDIGGDFIAVPENHHVLSPMMDGYMLVALRALQERSVCPIVYGVFGLGTDGETPPPLLAEALSRLPEVHEGTFDPTLIAPLAAFHRTRMEPIRYSRTADYTLREILGEGHPNPAEYRARFHTKPDKEAPSKVYYGPFLHEFDPQYYGRYYLFDDLEGVQNPYAIECGNGLEWFLQVQNARTRINHELNGQAYTDVGQILSLEKAWGKSIYFGTPSNKFSPDVQKQIVTDVVWSVRNQVYDYAMIFGQDIQPVESASLAIEPVSADLVLTTPRETDIAEAIRSLQHLLDR